MRPIHFLPFPTPDHPERRYTPPRRDDDDDAPREPSPAQ